MDWTNLADIRSAAALALPDRLDTERASPDGEGRECEPLAPLLLKDGSPMPRVLLVASAGGHWIELQRLCEAFIGMDCQFVSTSSGMTPPLGARAVLEIPDTARDSLVGVAPTLIRLAHIIRSFAPDLVVSTGAAPGALALLVAKLFGARTIWIDSIANSERMSLSGRLVRPVADVRVVQWAHLAHRDRSLRYLGQVL